MPKSKQSLPKEAIDNRSRQLNPHDPLYYQTRDLPEPKDLSKVEIPKKEKQ